MPKRKTISIPRLLTQQLGIKRSEAVRLIESDAVRTAGGIVLRETDVERHKIAGQTLTVGQQEVQVPE